MTRRKVVPGDTVRVDGDRHIYRVEARSRDGRLTLEAVTAHPRVRLADLPEDQAHLTGAYG